MTIVDSVKSKLPQPIEYLKDVIRGDTPSRVSAFLAVLSGIALVIGFCAITLAITKYDKKLTTELITVSGALVTLATFSKVDASTTTTQTTDNKQVIITDNGNSVASSSSNKETLQG